MGYHESGKRVYNDESLPHPCPRRRGIKGTFSAAVLAALEDTTKCRCIDHFDLIAGTSTGGIIALGLALGMSAQEIVSFYEEHGPAIFPSSSLASRSTGFFRQLFLGPKHSHATLREKLSLVLGDRKFGDSRVRLVIPTYDAINGRNFVLKTAHHPRFVFDVAAPAVDVALATSAAPTYFEAAPFPACQFKLRGWGRLGELPGYGGADGSDLFSRCTGRRD